MKFTSIPIPREIGAAGDIKISQAVFNMPNTVCKRTLAPTKHPPDGVATHPNDDPTLLYQYKQGMGATVPIQVTGEPEDNCEAHEMQCR